MSEQQAQQNAVATQRDMGGVFGSMKSFEDAQRIAQGLSRSDFVPKEFRGPGGIANCLVAMEMSQRTGAGIFAVMQNLHVIQGRPSWSASFIAATLNSSSRFRGAIRYIVEGSGDNLSCYAEATDAATGEAIKGPTITMQMAQEEGWLSKNGSKWKTMPEVMIRYRAASFFGRLYASDLLMGMHSDDEIIDGIIDTEVTSTEAVLEGLNAGVADGEGSNVIDEARDKDTSRKSSPKSEKRELPRRVESENGEVPHKSNGLGLFEETLGDGFPPSDTNGAV